MKRNVGNIDRVIRILIGLLCAYVAIAPTEVLTVDALRLFIGAYGLVNLVTGATGFCPLYKMASLSTYKEKL